MFNNAESVFEAMPSHFDAESAKDQNISYEFRIDDKVWQVAIYDGKCEVISGARKVPNVVLITDNSTWVRICNREISGVSAVISKKLKVQGNIIIADKLLEFFPFR